MNFVRLAFLMFFLTLRGQAADAAAQDPLVGEWQWMYKGVVKIFADGKAIYRRGRGAWKVVSSDPAVHKYEMSWVGTSTIDTLTLSANGKSFDILNSEGKRFAATRVEEKKAPEPAPAPGVGDGISSQMVRDMSDKLIFVDDASGVTGSGFVGQLGEKAYLFTNIHVVAGMKGPRFTRLDRSPVRLGGAAAAVGHDVMRFEAEATLKPLKIMEGVENKALIGDEVIVLGNSQGAHVIMPLEGKISGIGPNLVEVTAEFVPGNSGSPIIHKKTGEVIGIATYLITRDMKWSSEKSSEDDKSKKIRRFGYRIDSVAKWQPVVWPTFLAENTEIEKVHTLTRDLGRLLDDIRDHHTITPGLHQNSAVSRSIANYLEQPGRGRISEQDRLQKLQRFLSEMRLASQSDITAVKPRIGYDYFQRALSDEEPLRKQFRDIFDQLFKAQK